jgi:hypothetical protein
VIICVLVLAGDNVVVNTAILVFKMVSVLTYVYSLVGKNVSNSDINFSYLGSLLVQVLVNFFKCFKPNQLNLAFI